MKFAPPKSLPAGATPSAENMKDDETGEALMQRPDDTAEALVNRLQVRIPPQPACPRSSRLGLLASALRVLRIALALRPRLLMPAAVLRTQPACLPWPLSQILHCVCSGFALLPIQCSFPAAVLMRAGLPLGDGARSGALPSVRDLLLRQRQPGHG